ncbi:DGQHR domain-containing protein [Vibrio sp. 10N.222.51.E8]|uniref:DGQHR domain-containing protein n=1 Tax=Vibrio sp. 10N.222.51.E8 TaxID=3229625 RepID=UPI0035544586
MSNKFEIPAIKITQPLGTFYVFKMEADDLNKVSYSSRAKYKKSGFLNNVFSPISGTQRKLVDERGTEISRYIDSVECALPNSIVLGANISEDGSLIENKDEWYVEEDDFGNCILVIPTERELASIIDGQHRLAGCIASERKNIELLCAVYLDLPLPYQAYLFASINANQKKVSKSLAYELYGFGSDEEERIQWSPEKLAVSIARKLNFDSSSNIKGKIILGAQIADEKKGYISLASMVESILQLVTSNPKKDRDVILNYRNKSGRASLKPNAKIPLRGFYILGKDEEIENIIFNFINYIFDVKFYDKSSYLYKTIGIEALFNLLKKYLAINNNVFKVDDFNTFCSPIWTIDFSVDFFTASGIGKSRVSNALLLSTGIKDVKDVKNKNDAQTLKAILSL